MNPWHVLGIAPTREARDIKRAYAAALKKTHPEDDPEGFQALRRAYEAALGLAQRAAAISEAPEPQPEVPREPEGDLAAEAEALTSTAVPDFEAPAPEPESIGEVPKADPGLVAAPPPHVAARSLCEELLLLTPQERPKAIAAIMRRPGWEQLDFQSALHEQLLWIIEQQFDRYADVIPAAAAYYGWDQQRQRVGQPHPLMERIAARLEGRRWREAVEKDNNAVVREAFALLRQPPDEAAFRRFARWSRQLLTMRHLLVTLNTTQRAALFFEVDRASVTWWHEHVATFPTTIDRQLGAAFLGLIVGLLGFVVVRENVETSTSPALRLLPWLAFPLFWGVFAGLEWLGRWWKRALLQGRVPQLSDVRFRWHQDPRRRWALIGLAGVAVLLNLLAVFDERLAGATVVGLALLAFWYGFGYAFATMFLAMPLAIAMGLGIDAFYGSVPPLQRVLPKAPLPTFAYLIGALSFMPLTRAWSWAMNKLWKSPPNEPLKSAFFVGCVLLVGSIVLYGMWESAHPKPQAKAAQVQMSKAVKRKPRPVNEIIAAQPIMREKLDAVAQRFYAKKKPPTGATVDVQYVVTRAGAVEGVTVIASGYGNPAFDTAVADAVKSFAFPSNDRYALTPFVLRYGDLGGTGTIGLTVEATKSLAQAPATAPPSATASTPPARPPSDPFFESIREIKPLPPRPLEQVRDAKLDRGRFDLVYRKFFPTTDADPSASLELAFVIQTDGRVTDVKPQSSTFRNAAFEAAIAAEMAKLRFQDDPRYGPTRFTWKFTGVNQNTGRPPRPLSDVETGAARDDKFRAVVAQFYGQQRPPEGARIDLAYTVERDGTVSAAKVTKSTFENPAFEAAMVEVLKNLTFAPSTEYAATGFTLSYGDLTPKPQP
ncbi:MAG TPA: hypothetical protein VJM11_16345 [Nevskiaceae bacterium]|nr:hypothetical protein [Nevskiaceae bacterium]